MKWSSKIRKLFKKSDTQKVKYTTKDEAIIYGQPFNENSSYYPEEQELSISSDNQNLFNDSFSSISLISNMDQPIPATQFLFEQLESLSKQTNFEIRRLDCEGLLSNFDALRHLVIVFTIIADSGFKFPDYLFQPVTNQL